jgi:hypothetical protein
MDTIKRYLMNSAGTFAVAPQFGSLSLDKRAVSAPLFVGLRASVKALRE